MTVDTLRLGKIQLEIPVKSIPTHGRELHLTNHKVENVQKLVDEQEWKFIHTAKGSISLSSVFKTMIFVVFFSLFVLLLLLPLSLLYELLATNYEMVVFR